ncbi:MAG: nicotinate (nicotinamide) nucleotide adenylyltransferase [Aridibacter famidurans]|nr:nicotinate (nicotinamide) nucleotide adenylyltransferase [Aridibacter famidurans]
MSDRSANRKIAFFGGSFDPVHSGHIEIAKVLLNEFDLDVFVFVPAFHAPHKREFEPASPYHRFAMLALATDGMEDIGISTIELEDPDSPYTIETMEKVKVKFPDTEIFFVIGADSWMEITTWRLWEDVLTSTNIIVVTRPGVEIAFSHVTDEIRERIVDLRGRRKTGGAAYDSAGEDPDDSDRSLSIYITDSVNANVSATALRKSIRDSEDGWTKLVPAPAARHIVKYGLYR